MTEQTDPQDKRTQMAFDSTGDDAVGTSEDPADHPDPGPLPDAERPASYADEPGADFPDGERPVPDEISDGDSVDGQPGGPHADYLDE